MRILLISDTHGNLDIINELINKTNSSLVIHAGDFGFYDELSYKHVSARELFLLISHSPYWREYNVSKSTSRDILIKIVKKHSLLGTFSEYLNQIKNFKVPVYAVYGNHEDIYVVRNLKKNNPINNLHLIDEDNIYNLSNDTSSPLQLFGIGGNFLKGKKLLDRQVSGRAGKIWCTLHQFGVLYNNLKRKSKPSIFVSHVSPGKEPLLAKLISCYMPNIWVSGHMGSPHTCVWNQFAIRNMDESIEWFDSELELLKALDTDKLTDEGKIAYNLIKKDLPKKDFWYKKLWNINLPDVDMGYAVLVYVDEKFHVESYFL